MKSVRQFIVSDKVTSDTPTRGLIKTKQERGQEPLASPGTFLQIHEKNLFERQRDRSPIHWFNSQMSTIAEAG